MLIRPRVSLDYFRTFFCGQVNAAAWLAESAMRGISLQIRRRSANPLRAIAARFGLRRGDCVEETKSEARPVERDIAHVDLPRGRRREPDVWSNLRNLRADLWGARHGQLPRHHGGGVRDFLLPADLRHLGLPALEEARNRVLSRSRHYRVGSADAPVSISRRTE